MRRNLPGVTLIVVVTTFLTVLAVPAGAQTDTIQTNVPALKDVYANDFNIGCLLSYRHVGFRDDPPVPGQSGVIAPNGGYLIKFHMNSMSPGNNMKPQYTVNIAASAAAYAAAAAGDKDSVDTHPVVRFNGDIIAQLNWARRQGFTFRGHTLVWHSQTPGTAFFYSGYSASGIRLTKEKMIARMDGYIKEIIRLIHEGWPGLLSAMDVVNEAVSDAGTDRTTDSEWYTTFGDNSYIMKAFELTRKWAVHYGEIQMKLYYNDYNTQNASKADGIVRICTPIFQAGYLDGIGMQDHDAISSPSAAAWITSYNKFYPICTEMAVTELDVNTNSGTNNPSSSVLTAQANQYASLFKCFVERSYKSGRGKIINVSKDGLNDQYTFVTNQSTSLWNTQNQCKPAFYAVVEVGINYNALDSLSSSADSLQQNDYTPESWSHVAAALASAKAAMAQNYSTSLSAADALRQARDSLQAAIEGLVKISVDVKVVDGNNPTVFALNQNYPNPFNPTTAVSYQLPVASEVKLVAYDMLGREVAVLVNERKAPGSYEVQFSAGGGSASGGDAPELAAGVYLYRLTAGQYIESRKMVLLK